MAKYLWIYLVMLFGLCLCAVSDWRVRKVSISVVAATSAALILMQAVLGDLSLALLVGAFVVSLVFCGVSVVTAGQIGLGDGLLFGMTGLGLGLVSNIQMMAYCFAEIFVYALFLAIVCRKKRNHRIPLAPFMVVSSILVIIR